MNPPVPTGPAAARKTAREPAGKRAPRKPPARTNDPDRSVRWPDLYEALLSSARMSISIGMLIAAVAAVAALLAPSDETHLAALIGAAAVLLGGAPDRSPESPPSAPPTTGMWATAAASSAALAVVGIWFTAAHGDRPWIVAFGAMLGMSAALATWRWLRTGGRPPVGAPSGPSRGA